MKYLISMLYDSSLGEINVLKKIIVSAREEDTSTPGKKASLDLIFVLEYIRARDYFGVDYGVYDSIPFPMVPIFLVFVISKLPELTIYEPLKKNLYERLYDDIDKLDFGSAHVCLALENVSISIEIMKLYKRKLLAETTKRSKMEAQNKEKDRKIKELELRLQRVCG